VANQWFRMYSEFLTDPKVQMLSEADQRRYIMLLCLRCNGEVTLHETEIAFQLRISNEEWAKTKAVLIEKSLIDESNNPTNWDKRQFRSDSSAERVSRHRAKKKQESETACNVTVTAPDTDTDTDTDTEDKTQKTIRAPRFDALAHLVSIGVDPSIAADWIQSRKQLKAAPTQTAIDAIAREAAKARIALSDALSMCCQRGWRGFKAEWVKQDHAGSFTDKRQERDSAFLSAIGMSPRSNERVITGEVLP